MCSYLQQMLYFLIFFLCQLLPGHLIVAIFHHTVPGCLGSNGVLSADLSSLPTIILRRFLFTNDPAYLLLSVALGDVFLLPPPLLCGILFTLHKKTRKSVPDQSFALSHHTNSSWGATLVSFLMHLPQLLHCYDTGKSDLYQVKPTALF